LEGILQNNLDGLDVLVRRRMQDDNEGADETYGATQLAEDAQFFVEEV